jgi:hypothetical protein
MADEQVISQLKERVAFLEGLVMSLVAKNQPSADTTATPANSNPTNNVQLASAATINTPEADLPYLMRLPTELRMDILERVLHPIFARCPYGLISRLPLPVTTYTNKTRFPAVLHVSQSMRTESLTVYLTLAQTKLADLERENKKLYAEYQDFGEVSPVGRNWNALHVKGETIKRNFSAITKLETMLKVLEEGSQRK